MNESRSPEHVDLPIACTLDASDGAHRLARWRALSARDAPRVAREADALLVAYPAGRGVREELEVLAAAERRCCSFAQWEVEQDGDRVILRIRSHAHGLAAIASLFGVE